MHVCAGFPGNSFTCEEATRGERVTVEAATETKHRLPGCPIAAAGRGRRQLQTGSDLPASLRSVVLARRRPLIPSHSESHACLVPEIRGTRTTSRQRQAASRPRPACDKELAAARHQLTLARHVRHSQHAEASGTAYQCSECLEATEMQRCYQRGTARRRRDGRRHDEVSPSVCRDAGRHD